MSTRKSSANITQLASRLQLSKGTVSRILNDPTAPFAAHTRARVLSMATEIGYQPNPVARALATGRTGNVAFWIENVRTSYNARVVQQFESEVESDNHRLIVRLYGRDFEPGSGRGTSVFLPESADGIVTHGMPPPLWIKFLSDSNQHIPFIYTGSVTDTEILDYIEIDLSGASQAAMEHLIASGRQRIAYVSPHVSEDQRSVAYFSAMAAAGLAPEEIRSAGETRAAVREYVRDYITRCGPPQALFCHNDDVAIAAYRALCDLGLCVPEDVALVGCDGIEDTEYLATPISTISQPLEEMSRLAWQFIKTRMQEPDAPPQRATLTASLICRASSGA